MTPWRLGALTLVILLSVSTGITEARTVFATVRVQPLLIELTVPATPFSTGERVSVEATIHNLGPASLRDITVELRHPDGPLIVQRPVRHIPRLQGMQARSIDWRLCATEVGVYGVLVRVEAMGADGPTVAESETRLLHVTAEGRRPCR
jgi:uncharacterized membrane protein